MKTVVTTYANPDLDGTACVLTYAGWLNQKGRTVSPALFGSLDPETDYVVTKTSLSSPPRVSIEEEDAVILVDASKVASLPKGIKPSQIVEIIDHRSMTEAHLFPKASIQIEKVGAAATLIAEKYILTNSKLLADHAPLLYGAIVSNTLNFQAKVTHERDHQAAQWLTENYSIPPDLTQRMFESKSDVTGEILGQRLEDDLLVSRYGSKLISISQLEILNGQTVAYSRCDEILTILHRLATDNNLDYMFTSIIDLGKGITIFVTDDDALQKILKLLFKVEFDHNLAIYPQLILRKEIGPQLNSYFSV